MAKEPTFPSFATSLGNKPTPSLTCFSPSFQSPHNSQSTNSSFFRKRALLDRKKSRQTHLPIVSMLTRLPLSPTLMGTLVWPLPAPRTSQFQLYIIKPRHKFKTAPENCNRNLKHNALNCILISRSSPLRETRSLNDLSIKRTWFKVTSFQHYVPSS